MKHANQKTFKKFIKAPIALNSKTLGAVVVANLAEWSFMTTEDMGSNPVIRHFSKDHLFAVN